MSQHATPMHVHPPSVDCFLDCPGWRLLCGHSLDECHPDCLRWAGMTAEEATAHGQATLARVRAREQAHKNNRSAGTGDAA